MCLFLGIGTVINWFGRGLFCLSAIDYERLSKWHLGWFLRKKVIEQFFKNFLKCLKKLFDNFFFRGITSNATLITFRRRPRSRTISHEETSWSRCENICLSKRYLRPNVPHLKLALITNSVSSVHGTFRGCWKQGFFKVTI